jgi:uncharacterized protein (DUF433 family)
MAHERIVRAPAIIVEKPTIRGTRIAVEHILRKLAAGRAPADIVRDHPKLTLDDIRAAQAGAVEDVL